MDTIHFHFDSHGGFGEVTGLARLEEGGLELQFSTRDALIGVIRTDLRRLRIPLEVLAGARYRAGFLWLLPAIEPSSMRISPPLPAQLNESLAACWPLTKEVAVTDAPSANEPKGQLKAPVPPLIRLLPGAQAFQRLGRMPRTRRPTPCRTGLS
jgi:hypothetical protein